MFVTADKNVEYQQVVGTLPFGVVMLSLNNWRIIRDGNIDSIRNAIDHSRPGTIMYAECGRFVPTRFRKE